MIDPTEQGAPVIRRPRAISVQAAVLQHFADRGLILLGTGPLRRGIDPVERLEFLLDLGSGREPDWRILLSSLPDVAGVQPSERLVRLNSGEILKFYRSPRDSLGYAQIAHTGPKAFVQQLRQRPGWDEPPAPDEQTAFARIGLPWIDPELRDDPDVITCAENKESPA
ncbi:hypothetical protein [Thermithiobacillus plumbiphilus]|uniref:Uncharacterized protein n=1 Tax=Thermithiobacillus plumbiphilus TaxID=1729899 RepID=A0ABU9D3I5_9PROT